MADASLATINDESWNIDGAVNCTTRENVRVASLHSVYECVMRRIPIRSAPGAHAPYVYSVSGVSTAQEACLDCADIGIVASWQEYEWRPDEQRYRPRRCIDLCEACGIALEALPLGQRWVRSKAKAAVLKRCIRALERVGYPEAADALRALQ